MTQPEVDLNSAQNPSVEVPESEHCLSSSTATLSKRQAKRLATYVQRKEVRRQIRKAYKDRRKLRRQVLHNASTGEVESADISEPSTSPLSRKALHRVPPMSESACRARVVIDCAYDHLMSFKDICKLSNQICNCYALNRRFRDPVQLFVTGLGSQNRPDYLDDNKTTGIPNTRLIDRLRIAGCEKWDINLCDKDYTELFEAKSIVYLCAESPNRLPDRFFTPSADAVAATVIDDDISDSTRFSTADVYVIGGLVDHNHHVGHCYKQAVERAHRTARLPIAESGLVISGRHVLSTVQVFHALAPVLAGSMTWTESLNVAVPPRKLVQLAVDTV